MLRFFLLLCVSIGFAEAASAAIVYEAVKYQYRDAYTDRGTFYYGGSNPQVIAEGRSLQAYLNASVDPTRDLVVSTAREGRFGYNLVHRGLLTQPRIVYSDLLPPGMVATPYGIDVDDARNEAYANVPLYFRKRDMLAFAARTPDGSLVVPPQVPPPGTIVIRPMRAPTTQPTSAPATPQPILIIPKKSLIPPTAPDNHSITTTLASASASGR